MSASSLSSPTFVTPTRKILTSKDLEAFKKSATCAEMLEFVKLCADSIVGKRISDTYPVSEAILCFESFMNQLYDSVSDIPPIQQPMRFGNKAFRQWHSHLVAEAPGFLRTLLPEELHGAIEELVPYLATAFGNETRIDYGTGHEMTIAVFFLCLFKIRVIRKEDFPAVVLRGFRSYLRCMRRLQEEYMLEPAGSHGVWGLDDYYCLVFLWGAAQLIGNENILPSSIHKPDVLASGAAEYLYLDGIAFIKKIKSCAPFSETSPMLYDISTMADWTKVCTGLLKLYQGEVLFKLPVVQHLLFGAIIQCTWDEESTSTSPSESSSLPKPPQPLPVLGDPTVGNYTTCVMPAHHELNNSTLSVADLDLSRSPHSHSHRHPSTPDPFIQTGAAAVLAGYSGVHHLAPATTTTGAGARKSTSSAPVFGSQTPVHTDTHAAPAQGASAGGVAAGAGAGRAMGTVAPWATSTSTSRPPQQIISDTASAQLGAEFIQATAAVEGVATVASASEPTSTSVATTAPPANIGSVSSFSEEPHNS